MVDHKNATSGKRLGTYVALSFFLPVFLLYPYLLFSNLQGEGVSTGASGFVPEWLERYAVYKTVDPADRTTAKILHWVGMAVIPMFYASLVNVVAATVVVAGKLLQRVKRQAK